MAQNSCVLINSSNWLVYHSARLFLHLASPWSDSTAAVTNGSDAFNTRQISLTCLCALTPLTWRKQSAVQLSGDSSYSHQHASDHDRNQLLFIHQ